MYNVKRKVTKRGCGLKKRVAVVKGTKTEKAERAVKMEAPVLTKK